MLAPVEYVSKCGRCPDKVWLTSPSCASHVLSSLAIFLLVLPRNIVCIVACTVCADAYAPGFGYSCHKCDGPTGDSAIAIGFIIFAVVVIITALLLLELARRIDGEGMDGEGMDGANGGREGEPRRFKRGVNWVLSIIAKSFPVTAFKMLIVVWQIVTQVCHAHAWNWFRSHLFFFAWHRNGRQ